MRYSFLILLLPIVSLSFGQGRYPLHAATATKVVATDNFDSYTTDGALLTGQGNWLRERLDQKVAYSASNGEVWSNGSGGNEVATYYNDTFDDDQYSEVKITATNAGGQIGVSVRCGGGISSYYLFYGNSSSCWFGKMDAGSFTSFGSGTAFEVNDIIRIEAEGTTIRAYRNGELDTSVGGGDGIVTDSGLTSGKAGLSGYNSTTSTRCDNWEGGNL